MTRIAALDIGTNTVLMLVAEARAGEVIAISDSAEIARLGEGVDRTRRLSPEAITPTATLAFNAGMRYFVYAIGSVSGGTFDFIVQAVR